MTSSEDKPVETVSLKKVPPGDLGVPRKPSFRCGPPTRGHLPRVARRVVLPASTVERLTNKFNLLSNTQNSPTKPILTKGNQNFRVVVCKPAVKRKSCKVSDNIKSTRKKFENDLVANQSIEQLSDAFDGNKIGGDHNISEPIYDKSVLPVRTAVGIFENVAKHKKPVAAVKPILKTIEEKPKTKLHPKDSLSRARYNVMRRSREETATAMKGKNDFIGKQLNLKQNEVIEGEKCDKKCHNLRKSEKDCLIENENESEEVSKTVLPDEVKPEVQMCCEMSKVDEPQRHLSNNICNSDSVKVSSIFSRISQSSIYTNKALGKERRFATMLKNKEEENESCDKHVKFTSPNRNVMTDLANIMRTSVNEKKATQKNIPTHVGYELPSPSYSLNKQLRIKDNPTEKPAIENTTNEQSKADNGCGSLQPNTSFLWSKPASVEPQYKPLPKPPDHFIPDILYESSTSHSFLEEEEGVYDDICAKIIDEDIYDDVGVASLNQRNNSLYCISEKLDSLNIYEDIRSVRAAVEGYELVNSDILEGYEVVPNGCHNSKNNKIDNVDELYDDACYESIYGGRSARSDESVKSSFEKNNSLYGVLPNGIKATSTESVRETDTNSDYQESPNGLSPAESEISTSDDWVEVSDSEPEHTVFLIHERNKKARTGHSGCKGRANWSELQKRTSQKCANEELASGSNEEHLYESIKQEETDALSIPNLSSLTNIPTSVEDIADDVSCIDDFESSDEECPYAQLPAEPTTQYNITRSLRAAGKKLKQNLTLRKSDFSKSLKKLRPKLRTEAEDKSPDVSGSTSGSSKFYCEVGAGKSRRPSGPPPPPPPVDVETSRPASGVQYADLKINGSELYAECGLFKQRLRPRPDSQSSWYAEIGLYSTNGKCDQPRAKQLFADEPLYQFYTECVNQQARDDILRHYDSDGYEAINDYYSLVNDKRRTLDVKVGIPNLEDFASEPERKISFQTQNRTLWCQTPEVVSSCILPTLTEQQRKLQEAKFEILASEGSYIHSLTVLEQHFMPRLSELVTTREHRLLFSNILAVKAVSEILLNELEACWRDNIMLLGISDIVHKHALEGFKVYVKFCKHHSAMYRALRDLSSNNSAFSSALNQLQSSPVCHSLSLHSFLLLPMQRITRLPLLFGAMLARLDKTDEEYLPCKNAFELLNKIVKECDDEASKMEKCEEMLLLSQQLEFPKGIRRIPIICGSRVLVKRGPANLLLGKEDSKLTFGRRVSKLPVVVLLFTDLMILARQKSNRSLVVIDFCARNLVELEVCDGTSLPSISSQKNLMLLTILENHENKTVEMMLSFELESDIQRWTDLVCPKSSQNPEETVYEEWDCPQVIVIYEFNAAQPDELTLCIGDVVNVLKKISDGWYQGERLRDGARGWFPANHTQEISSPHVRAKNKKQRYKLLAMSGNFLQQQYNVKVTGVS